MEAIIIAIDHLSIAHYTCMAGATLWAYDYLLTIHEEALRIWPTKFSLVKVLYFTNRYVAVPYLTLQLYHHLAIVPLRAGTIFYAVAVLICRELEVLSATWLMMIRVLVLYPGTRWVKPVLYVAFVLMHIVTLGFGVHSITESWSTWAYSPVIRICINSIPRFIRVIYFTQIPFEFLLIIMLLVHYWKVSRGDSLTKATPLLSALYKGGFLAFLTTVAVLLWAGLVIVCLDSTYWQMTTSIDLAITSTCISRVFLQLNKAATPNNTEQFGVSGTGWDVSTNLGVRMPGHGSLTFGTSIQPDVSVPVAPTEVPKEGDEWMEMEAPSTRHRPDEV